MTEKDLHTKSIMDSLLAGNILEREAADMLSLSIRQTERIKKRVREEGDVGIIHRLRGKTSNHHHDPTKYDEAIRIITSQYSDYSYVMMYEKLRDKHRINISMPTLRNELIRRGIRMVRKQKKTDIQRTMRERKSCYGEMIQYDGSYHLWFENRAPEACLLVSVDDATGETFAHFDQSEGLWPTYRFWREYIAGENNQGGFGKPKSIYLDRFSTYKINHPNATDDHELTTQFGRVCRQLGIELIFAHSPEGKGRVERMNGTLQDRLVKELREAGIPHTNNIQEGLDEANLFLREIFLPKFNAQFRVEPNSSSDMHRVLREDEKVLLDELFTEQKTRKVQNDFTVRFEGKIWQLYRNKEGGSIVSKGEYVYIDRDMDDAIHISNKNHHRLIAKELPEIPKKSSTLHLPPVIGEDPIIVKTRHMEQLKQEEKVKQEQEKQIRDEQKKRLSLARQTFHKEHGRYAKFPTPVPS